MFSKRLLSGAALAALSLSMGGVAQAQSTASQIQEDTIVVTGTRPTMNGEISAETSTKARATITQDYIATQTSGQTVLQTINLIPGVNFTNTDAYGSSGGAINMRGFDGARISLTFDGVPLNDTGNYAIYSNQQLDPELITRANVNLGTTDVDSPTAAATGGTVNYVTRIPGERPSIMASQSFGSWDFHRGFVLVDTGAIGPFGARAFGAASFTEYDQFIGPGDLQKTQFNGGIYQPLGNNGDFFRISAHYNENRNDFYYRFSSAQYNAGYRENLASCTPLPGINGVADNSNSDNCTASNFRVYQGQSINPSNTGNIRGQALFTLSPSMTLTVDPSFQYVLANGGGTMVVSENSPQLITNQGVTGVDLNHDGDYLDQVRLYAPSNTNTHRYGVTSSLIWDINSNNRVRFGYTWDWGRHRQTGEFGYLLPNGDPQNVFGGREGTPVLTGDGGVFQKRDRLSIAELNQFSAEYRGDFMDDALTVIIGLRAPHFERHLNQYCYSKKGNSSSTQYCTQQTPIASPTSPGFFRFDLNGDGDVLDAGETQDYAPPFTGSVSYDDVLPNIGLVFRPGADQQIFFNYAEGLSAPRTDDLYSGITTAQLGDVQPETTQDYDLGYRYQGSSLLFSATAWYNHFENRIERSQDPLDPTLFYSRNVGTVDLWGLEAAAGWQATDALFLYGALSWTDSELKNGGYSVVDTPDWTATARAEYEVGPFTLGAQARYVGDRFANDYNAEVAPHYTVVDADVRLDLGEVANGRGAYLQLNVINLFDEEYFGQMSSGTGSGTALYNLGAPQTWMLTLRTEF
jgi:iron complex outermembrane receptor protein